jgi:hypothetical protein
MTAKEFLDLSTKLVNDLQRWVEEAANDGTLAASDFEALRTATQIVEKVTLREIDTKPDDEGGTIII